MRVCKTPYKDPYKAGDVTTPVEIDVERWNAERQPNFLWS